MKKVQPFLDEPYQEFPTNEEYITINEKIDNVLKLWQERVAKLKEKINEPSK